MPKYPSMTVATMFEAAKKVASGTQGTIVYEYAACRRKEHPAVLIEVYDDHIIISKMKKMKLERIYFKDLRQIKELPIDPHDTLRLFYADTLRTAWKDPERRPLLEENLALQRAEKKKTPALI